MRRVVETVHAVTGLGEQVRVTPLTTRHVEDAGTRWKGEQLDQSSDLAAIAREIEDRLIFEQVVGVEVGLPPLGRLLGGRQKKTGSR
jgi:hypothetical protein